jgi:TP901 family phage tail tape measure protein
MTTRTVSVALELQLQDYLQGMQSAATATTELATTARTASTATTQLAQSARAAGTAGAQLAQSTSTATTATAALAQSAEVAAAATTELAAAESTATTAATELAATETTASGAAAELAATEATAATATADLAAAEAAAAAATAELAAAEAAAATGAAELAATGSAASTASADLAAAQATAAAASTELAAAQAIAATASADLAAAQAAAAAGTTELSAAAIAAAATADLAAAETAATAAATALTTATSAAATAATSLAAAETVAAAAAAELAALEATAAVGSAELAAAEAAAATATADLAAAEAAAVVTSADLTVAAAAAATASTDLAAAQAAAATATARAASASRSAMADVAAGAAASGVALLGLAGVAIYASAHFDKAMSEVGAVTNATASQMGNLRVAALEAGAATQYSATEAAIAEGELAKAGMTTEDILSGGLSGALSLAAAGQMELADAATITAKAMNMFGLSATQAGHIADVFAASANSTAADMHGLGLGLQQVGLVANQVGWTFEDTVAVLGAFADRGLQGSDGATSLKTALMALSAPVPKAAEVMRQLGLTIWDSQGHMLGAADLAGQLQVALGGLSDAERQAAMQQIFGSDAIRAGNVLLSLGTEGVQRYRDALDDQGAASEMAAAKTNNLAGDFERLTGSLETMAISSGSGAAGGLRTLVQAMDRAVNSAAMIPGPVLAGGVAVAGLTGAFLLASAGAAKFKLALAESLAGLAAAGPRMATFASGLQTAIGIMGKFTAGLMLMQVATAALGSSATPQLGALSRGLEEFGESGKLSGEVAKTFGKDLDRLKYDLGTLDSGIPSSIGNSISHTVEGLTGLGNAMDESLVHAKERLGGIDQALASLVQSGKADQAAAAFSRIQEIAAKQGVSTRELMAAMPQYAAAMDAAATAAKSEGEAATEAASKNAKLATNLEEAVSKAGSFKDAFDQLKGTLFGSLDATMAAEQAIDDLAETLAKNGNQFDLNSRAGRENTKAIEEGITAARDAAQAKYAETGSVTAANDVYQAYLQRLREAAGNSGALRGQVDQLINKYGQMPPLVATTVSASGLREVSQELYGVIQKLWQIDGTVSRADVYVQLHQMDSIEDRRLQRRWGGVVQHAAVGALRSPEIYSAGPTPLYAFAEKQTGGEAFIPRRGDLARSRQIAEHVVGSWLGGTVSWGQQGGAAIVSAPTINLAVYAGIGADAEAISARSRQAIADVIDQYNLANVR